MMQARAETSLGDEEAGPKRAPTQDRARASLERMLSATETLLSERGSGSFTLLEVSAVGRISIGSIYFRFENKETLIRAVQARVMERIDAEHAGIVEKAASRRAPDPESQIRAIIEELGDFLRRHAVILHPLMVCAQEDAALLRRGAESYRHLTQCIGEALSAYTADMRCEDPQAAIQSVVDIAFAAFSRQLGLGLTGRAVAEPNWTRVHADMGRMAAAFLLNPRR